PYTNALPILISVLRLRHVAEAPAGREPCVRGPHAFGDEAICLEVEMAANLLLEIALAAAKDRHLIPPRAPAQAHARSIQPGGSSGRSPTRIACGRPR